MSPPKPVYASPPDAKFIEECCDLVGARTGLQVRAKDRDALARSLSTRLESLKIGASDYLQLLRRQNTPDGEWVFLMPLLTNGESYFQRDRGQFELLQNTILPELIERRREAGQTTLRLWSAGCSTGEEAYSLAMTVQPLLPVGWNLLVLGTDINLVSLSKARRAFYGAWSFRGVEDATRGLFFRPVSGGFEVAASLRERVSFDYCNLSANDWPDTERGIGDMDLILCRNVLIYFQREAVAGVVERFTRALRPGGCLLTGHAELHDQDVAPLRARLFPQSTIYQKLSRPSSPTTALPTPTPIATSIQRAVAPTSTPTPILRAALQYAPKRPAKTASQWFQEASAFADGGQLEEAERCCRGAVETDAGHIGAYELWARVEEERGKFSGAKELLKKVIYLAPSQPDAYLELAALYERGGDLIRARQMRVSALVLLRALPPDQTDSRGGGQGVREQMQHLENLLGTTHSGIESPQPGARR